MSGDAIFGLGGKDGLGVVKAAEDAPRFMPEEAPTAGSGLFLDSPSAPAALVFICDVLVGEVNLNLYKQKMNIMIKLVPSSTGR